VIWVIRFVLACIIRYPTWVGVIDIICTLIVMFIMALAIMQAIKQRKKGGLGYVSKKESKAIN